MPDDSLLLGQLAEEFTARLRSGDLPAVEDYITRHPALAERIRALFPTLLMLEGLAGPQAARVADNGVDRIGQVFGNYRIVSEVGRGGMGIVYEAVHQPLGKRVALKLLTVAEGPGSAGLLERFFREARTAAGLHHTNIVPVFDIGQVGGTPYYAMQYIAGRGLDQVLRNGAPAVTTIAVAPRPESARGALAESAPPRRLGSRRFHSYFCGAGQLFGLLPAGCGARNSDGGSTGIVLAMFAGL
jgi:hypothetical protein